MTVLLPELKNKVLYLSLNRPERANSLNPPLLVELRNEILNAQKNPNVRVIVLTGMGEKDFCTGIDVASVSNFTTEGKVNLALVAGDIATLLFSGKPSIVAINGRAMGMGIVFASAADYRLMVDTCEWSMPEVTAGIFPGASCIAIMSRVCGVSWTRRILMTGQKFTPEHAIQACVADEICSPSERLKKTTKMARTLKTYNQINLKSIKMATIGMPDMNYDDSLNLEKELSAWYEWEDPENTLKQIIKNHSIQFTLKGDPDLLISEFNMHNK
ncbi:MAG: enoyl-CoA hydratase/isomerase family protein [Promethearchaeota archaeon]